MKPEVSCRLCFYRKLFEWNVIRRQRPISRSFLPLFYHPPDSARRGRRRASPLENWEQFLQRVHKYKNLDELTPYTLRELVKGVYIEAPDKSGGKRRQSIRISCHLVGFIPVEERRKQERHERSHAVPAKMRYYFLTSPAHCEAGRCFYQIQRREEITWCRRCGRQHRPGRERYSRAH